MPLFTIGIPTYNRPDFLQRAISSVLAQTYWDFELIIIDDASDSEQTGQIVELFADERIRFIRNKTNQGIAVNVNRVFTEARGEYIGFLGDDDIFKPNLLEHIHDIIQKKGKYEFIAFNLSLVTDKGAVLMENYFNMVHDTVFQPYHYLEYHFGGRQKFHIPGTFFVRKAFLDQYHLAYRPEVKGIDVFFSLEVNCYTAIYIATTPLYVHTRHALQESHTQNRPLHWKLNYFSGLACLLNKHNLQYLLPLLRRCFLPNMPAVLLDIVAVQHKEEMYKRFFTFHKDFSWMTESHPDFLKMNLFNVLLEINDIIPVDKPEPIPQSVQDYYLGWLTLLKNKNQGISHVLKKDHIQSVAVFGTLLTGVLLGLDLAREKIKLQVFLDNHKQNDFIIGVPVSLPQWLSDHPVDAVLISIEREDYSQIKNQLEEIIGNNTIPIISWRSLVTESIKK